MNFCIDKMFGKGIIYQQNLKMNDIVRKQFFYHITVKNEYVNKTIFPFLYNCQKRMFLSINL